MQFGRRKSFFMLLLSSLLLLLLLVSVSLTVVVVATDSTVPQQQLLILSDGTTIDIDPTKHDQFDIIDNNNNNNNNNVVVVDNNSVGASVESSSSEEQQEQQQKTTPLAAGAAAAAEAGSTTTDTTNTSTSSDTDEDDNEEDYNNDEEDTANYDDDEEEGYDDESDEEDDDDNNYNDNVDVWFGKGKGVIPPVPEIDTDGYATVVYGKKQHIASSYDEVEYQNTIARLQSMHEYMYKTVYMELPDNLQNDCKLRDKLCTYWAAIGECDANPAYMKVQCAPACSTCDQLLYEVRCPIPSNLTDNDVWKGGNNNEMNNMFTNIITNPYYKETYGPITIISQPTIKQQQQQPETTDETSSEDRKLQPVVEYEDDAPWLITIDDFVSEEECLTLIELGANEGYKRSEDVGERLFDGTYAGVQSTGRTSTNAWCDDTCYTNTTSFRVIQKIENLTGISDQNAEHLQLLRYEIGQFYESHHDYIDHDIERPQGVRILTVYLYLNNVAEGGGTNFPLLSQTVMPKRGRVVIWPSVFNDRPNDEDKRTTHQALPVINGIKYGANAWIHMRDFKTPHNKSCT